MQSIENTFPKLNSSWLYKGEGKMLKSNLNEAIEKDIEDFIKVPLVPIRGKAGYLTGYGDPEYIESLPRIPVIVDRTYHGKYRCFEAEGDSMDDGSRNAICDRDIVLGREVKRELWRSKLHYRDWNFIIVHQDGITIKSITNHDLEKGTITCHSLNPLYDDFELNLDQVKELYNLIKIVDRSARK
jgi:phage repressor protein C with HTH and peptisase S24 domain